MKICPYCAEVIREGAIVCRYCGRDIPPAPVPPDVPGVYAQYYSSAGGRVKPAWAKVGLAVLLAGVIPPIAGYAVLISGMLAGFAVNYPPFRPNYLIVHFVVHLLPLPLGLWAALAWPGRHWRGYTFLGLLAAALEAAAVALIVGIERNLVARGLLPIEPIIVLAEDWIGLVATALLFAAGGLFGDLIERWRSPAGTEPSTSERQLIEHASLRGGRTAREPGKLTLVLIQSMGPALLAFLGTLVTAAVTLAK